jgi:hypothetical protein
MSKVYLACDKSTRGKGPNTVNHYTKLSFYYNKDFCEVDFFSFCADGSDGSNIDCAEAIDHALRTKLLDAIPKLDGLAGDKMMG